MQTYSQYFKVVCIKLFYILYLWFIYLGIFELNTVQVAQTHVTRKRCKVVYIPKLTSDLCAWRVENKRLCMRNKILRSTNAKNELKWIKKTYRWCIPLCLVSARLLLFFFCFGFFLPLLHNHHRYPRRPRGSQSGQEKRRDESFLADWLPLGLQGCITTVPPLKGWSQRWSFWSGRDLDQSQKNAIFSVEIQSTAKFFSSSSQEKNLFFLSGKSAQKCLIISPSSWAICTWLRPASGYGLKGSQLTTEWQFFLIVRW